MEQANKTNFELVVFSDDWHGLPFSCKHLLKQFLPEIPIIWVETIGLRSPGLNLYDVKRAFHKIGGWIKNSEAELPDLPANLRVLDPFQIPYNQFEWIRNRNKNKMISSINELAGSDSTRKRIILTTWPFLGNIFGQLGEDISIYYRVDDFTEFPGVRKAMMERLENEIMNKADLVVATADKLLEIPDKKKARYLPHGVDYDHFSSGTDDRRFSDTFSNIPSPRIGFFGLLNSWLDFDLIQATAQKYPQWSFVIIGPSQLPDSELPRNKNIFYLGPKSYDELPFYASNFDVGLIPFQINKLTIAVNPLKLMEYLALGLPVVSTPLPEVVKYGKMVNIGEDVDSFAAAIEKALTQNTQKSKTQRQQAALNSSWRTKSEQLLQWITEELK